jgi:hypothetical protein
VIVMRPDHRGVGGVGIPSGFPRLLASLVPEMWCRVFIRACHPWMVVSFDHLVKELDQWADEDPARHRRR